MTITKRHVRNLRRCGSRGGTTTQTIVAMLVALTALTTTPALAQDSTQPLLGAVKITDTLWIQQTTAGLDYAVNDNAREYLTLRPGVTFVAPGEIKLAWKGFNPLAVTVAASETTASDPNFVQLTDFLGTLAKLPDLVSKPQSGPLVKCPATREAADLLERLYNALNKGSIVSGELTKWRKALAEQPGRASVEKVQSDMGDTVTTIRGGVKNARTAWAELGGLAEKMRGEIALARQAELAKKAQEDKAKAEKELADLRDPKKKAAAPTRAGSETTAATDTKPAPASPPAAGVGNPGAGTGNPGAGTGTPQASGGTTTTPTTPTSGTAGSTSTTCEDAVILVGLIAEALKVTEVENRIDVLDRLAGDLEKLQSSLDAVVKGTWVGDSYVFYRTTASPKEIKTITVKAVQLSTRVVSGVLVRTTDNDKAQSVAFNLRQYSAVVTEVVPGFVVARVKAPQYETGLDANGKTVVVRGKDKDVSFGGALLLNAIFGTHRQSFLYPLVQVGVSVSPDGPGVLAGLGGRFTGARSLAFSAGGVLAWVKDLQTLQPGSPVASKNDIKADLAYKYDVKWYFALQYNFK